MHLLLELFFLFWLDSEVLLRVESLGRPDTQVVAPAAHLIFNLLILHNLSQTARVLVNLRRVSILVQLLGEVTEPDKEILSVGLDLVL